MIKKIKEKPIMWLTLILLISSLGSLGYLIFGILRISNVENVLRILVCILLLFIIIYYFLIFYNNLYKGKKAKIIFISLLFLITFLITGYANILINKVYSGINNVYKDANTYSVSLVTLISNEYNVDDLNNVKIGIINKDVDNYTYTTSYNAFNSKKLYKNELVTYESNNELLEALYNKDVDLIFISNEYVALFDSNEKYKDIANETKALFTYEETFKKESEKEISKDANEPVTFLLLGMDSTVSDISKVTSYNADTIMVLTFNPKNNKATILSIPRDTYTPIMCFNNHIESKITHSGWQDVSCVKSTVENLLGIDIDYYAKINFTALVKIVDELGGIEVDVPYSFCEQDSQRRWEQYTIYLEKGLQTINGEEALALSRNRHPNPGMCSEKWTSYYSSDMVRSENQQKVLNALLNKIAKNIDLNTLYNLLDIVGNNVDTNMEVDDITSYYNILKNMVSSSDSVIKFEKLKLNTYGKYMFDAALNMSGISFQVYYQDSLEEITKEMKINLGLIEPDIIKTIEFDANESYETRIIGDVDNVAKTYEILPNFVNQDLSVFISWASSHKIKYNIEYEENKEYANNVIISQSIPYSYRLDKITSTLTIKANKIKTTNITEKPNNNDEKTSSSNNNSSKVNNEESTEKTEETTNIENNETE